MRQEQDEPITELLSQWSAGNQQALERLTPLVYGELARQQFEEVLARFERSVGVKHPFATEALLGMGETLKAAGKVERAETFYRAALDNLQGPYAERRVIMAECLEGYADLARRRGRQEEAAAIAARAAKVRAYLHAELLKTNRA